MHCRHIARLKKLGAAEAYADDHGNDVMTNTAEVGAALAAFSVLSLWFSDSVDAFCIAFYIIFNWYGTQPVRNN